MCFCVCLSLCLSARALLYYVRLLGLVKDFLGGETSSATTFFVALNWAEKEITRSNTFVSLSLSRRTHTTYLFCLKRETTKRESVCVRVNDDDEKKVS